MKDLEQKLGVEFKNPSLLEKALTHKSYSYEKNESSGDDTHNEKLEFLGDAVLDLALAEYLMEVFPDQNEGPLSKMRAHLVSESGLSQVAVEWGLYDKIYLGKGEIQTQGAMKPRLLASCLEALIGALFLDQGYETSRVVIRKMFHQRLSALQSADFDQDFKSKLQEMVQAYNRMTPVYELKSSSGPAHDRTFEVRVLVAAEELALGTGKNKKAAEQKAAELALHNFSQRMTK